MDLSNMGVYLVQPKGTNLRIIYNKKDQAKIKNKDRTLKVNCDYIKFGKSQSLSSRNSEYKDIFGNDVKFESIIFIENTNIMVDFEEHMKNKFENYRVKSPNSGKLLEWMKNINFIFAKKLILAEYKVHY
jgi:hypothetical protein